MFSTILVVLVFVPLFALGGMEGRLFTPLGVAYIVSILASLVVSLTVTPVLSYWLLPRARFMEHEKDGSAAAIPQMDRRLCHSRSASGIRGRFWRASRRLWPSALVTVTQLGRDFLPPFNEGSVQVNVLLPPGTSLATSNRIAGDGRPADQKDARSRGLRPPHRPGGTRRTRRRRQRVGDHHQLRSRTRSQPREEVLADLREELTQVPGVVISAEQPLAHLISHMLSGVKAQVGIKLYGDDLTILRAKANEMKAAIAGVPGVKDLMVEQQIEIPQLQIKLDRDRLASYGLNSTT